MKIQKRSALKKAWALLTAGGVTSAVLLSVTSSAGIQGSGFRSLLAVGTVTEPVQPGTGTLVVGGFRYSTSHALIQVDGHAATQGQIHRGDVVSLLASTAADGTAASASQVAISGRVQGTVSSVDVPSATVFVLGQTVHVTPQTAFSSAVTTTGLSALQSGTVVEVNGFANSTGDLVATFIDTQGQSNISRVVGSVRSLDLNRHTFYVNALKIDYGSAGVVTGLREGASVSVQGVRFTADGALLANQVHSSAAVPGLPGSTGRIQGLITNLPSSAYFEVNGQRILLNTQTQLKLGVPLALDDAIEVIGTFDTAGVLVAASVQTFK